MNSLPNRSSISPFRKSVNFNTLDNKSTNNKNRQSLKIITSPPDEQEQMEAITKSPSRVRQRLSSLFRTSSPVVMTLKETFNSKRSASTISFASPLAEEETTITKSPQQMEPMDDSHSTTTTLSSDSSDHMPASPADAANTLFSSPEGIAQQTTIWQPSVTILSYEDDNNNTSIGLEADKIIEREQLPQFAVTKTSSSLAYQVHQILGSTLDEVDEEIDQDWENSRNMLHQSLVSTGDRNRQYTF